MRRDASRLQLSPTAYKRKGVKVSPGMTVGYVVRDANRWDVDTEWDASEFDQDYYRKLIGKAWKVAAFVFRFIDGTGG